jgi:two-component system response regulator DesR
MTTDRCRVLCVDDNDYICEAIRRRMEREEGFCYVGSLSAADDLVEEAVRTRAQLICLDMNMPGKDPLEAVRELAERCPGVRVVALSAYLQDDIIDRALDAGLAGYISKSEEPVVLMAALRRIVAGEVVLSPEVLRYYVTSGKIGRPGAKAQGAPASDAAARAG